MFRRAPSIPTANDLPVSWLSSRESVGGLSDLSRMAKGLQDLFCGAAHNYMFW